MELTLGSDVLTPDQEHPFDLFSTILIDWTPLTNNWYTLIIYCLPPDGLDIYLQLLLVNIPSNRVSEGEALLQYQPPSPPFGTGVYHYSIVLALQGRAVPSALSLSRHNFDLDSFAEQYQLSLVDQQTIALDSNSRLWYLK